MPGSEWLAAAAVHPIVLIAVGSAVGGNLRYWLGRWVDSQPWAAGLPWGTFVVNVSGSFVLGFLAVWFIEHLEPSRHDLYLLLGTGLCGGYTTFSTFEWDTYRLIREGSWPAALANVLVSVVAGLLAVVLGAAAAHQVFGRR